MKYYKELLLKKLCDSGWELIEQDDETDWWLEELWTVKSIKKNWGQELKILFLVDPQYEGRIKSRGVWAVMASEKTPKERPLNPGISQITLSKGNFEQNLNEFVSIINEFRSHNCL